MGCQGRFHFSCADAVARHVYDVVHAPCYGVLTICGALAAVPSEVVPLCTPSSFHGTLRQAVTTDSGILKVLLSDSTPVSAQGTVCRGCHYGLPTGKHAASRTGSHTEGWREQQSLTGKAEK